jgi:hypothetical protein
MIKLFVPPLEGNKFTSLLHGDEQFAPAYDVASARFNSPEMATGPTSRSEAGRWNDNRYDQDVSLLLPLPFTGGSVSTIGLKCSKNDFLDLEFTRACLKHATQWYVWCLEASKNRPNFLNSSSQRFTRRTMSRQFANLRLSNHPDKH